MHDVSVRSPPCPCNSQLPSRQLCFVVAMLNEMLITGLSVQSGHAGRIIEGIIMGVGWYRTMIRSFEKEVCIVRTRVGYTQLCVLTHPGSERNPQG
jgi:hypothetical protein